MTKMNQAAVLEMYFRALPEVARAVAEPLSKVDTITKDTVPGLRILRGLGAEDVFARRYRDASQELRRRGV